MAARARRTIMSVVDPASSIESGDVLRRALTDDLGIQPRRRRLPPQSRFFRLGPGSPQSFLLDRSGIAHVHHQEHHAQKHARLERALPLCYLFMFSSVPVAAVEHLSLCFSSLRRRGGYIVSGSSAEAARESWSLLGEWRLTSDRGTSRHAEERF